jgi:hypothetical protein
MEIARKKSTYFPFNYLPSRYLRNQLNIGHYKYLDLIDCFFLNKKIIIFLSKKMKILKIIKIN